MSTLVKCSILGMFVLTALNVQAQVLTVTANGAICGHGLSDPKDARIIAAAHRIVVNARKVESNKILKVLDQERAKMKNLPKTQSQIIKSLRESVASIPTLNSQLTKDEANYRRTLHLNQPAIDRYEAALRDPSGKGKVQMDTLKKAADEAKANISRARVGRDQADAALDDLRNRIALIQFDAHSFPDKIVDQKGEVLEVAGLYRKIYSAPEAGNYEAIAQYLARRYDENPEMLAQSDLINQEAAQFATQLAYQELKVAGQHGRVGDWLAYSYNPKNDTMIYNAATNPDTTFAGETPNP